MSVQLRKYTFEIGAYISITRHYDPEDRFWNLPEDKQLRKAIADTQRDLTLAADVLAKVPHQVRG